MFTNLLVLFVCLFALVSNLHGTCWSSRGGRVAFQLSRWKRAMHHLVLGKMERWERARPSSTACWVLTHYNSQSPRQNISFFFAAITFRSATQHLRYWSMRGSVSRRDKQRMGGWRMKGGQERRNIAVNNSTFGPASVWAWHPTVCDS